MNVLRFGMIGLNDGNGHPYSWSAICNGYNPEFMSSCPFPIIPAYLDKQKFPEAAISRAKVTHVWTQDFKLSEHIAASTYIPNIVSNPNEMLGSVDAILLARDDYENHVEMSRPILKAGIPIYIDKPISCDLQSLEEIYKEQKYEGQIFSCTALAYADEFILSKEERKSLGKISHVCATTIKDWNKYGVHIIEPTLRILETKNNPLAVSSMHAGGKSVVVVEWEEFSATFTALGDSKGNISIKIFGNSGFKELIFTDAFNAFKNAINGFIDGIIEKKTMTDKSHLERVVQLIERGNRGY